MGEVSPRASACPPSATRTPRSSGGCSPASRETPGIVQAAGNLKKVSLERGGKSPAIVVPDADLDDAIAGTASAIFSMGQCCTAGSRLLAHGSVCGRVVEGLAAEAAKRKVGHGLDRETTLGPRVSQEQHRRVTGFLDSGRSEGAEVVTGGEMVGNRGSFVAPTVPAKTTRDTRVVREEIVGPVVCVQPFEEDDLDGIARFAHDAEYGPSASIWTQDLTEAHSLARRIRAGTVRVDTHDGGDPALPFGGCEQSGRGREMGREVVALSTETKAVGARLV